MSLCFITTFTKKRFDILSPAIESLDIHDIGHALSMLCRANGHSKTFYSVAQHSINCMREAEARRLSIRMQLACLLHDASEAYISDITRPLKRFLPQYADIEEPIQELVYRKWLVEPLSPTEVIQLKDVDDSLLYHEMLFFMNEVITQTPPQLLTIPTFIDQGFSITETEFVDTFTTLFQKYTVLVLSHNNEGAK